MSDEIVKRVVLKGKHGLHARPATSFVQTAKQYASDVSILARGEEVDGKSIISILTLGLGQGAEIEIKAVGDDAAATVDALLKLVNEGEAFD